MRLLLSVFLMFILVSSATMTNFAFAYEKENHYWLKIALALNCGFTLDEARLIGIGDFSIDEDPDTQPVRSGSDKDNAKWKWHALPTENPDVDKNEVSKGNQEIKQRQHELYDRAMNEKDTPMKLFKFGQYLHYQEDKWSHWGYTTGMGHAVPNVVPGMDSPDETHANPEHYRYMVFDSMVNLGKLAKSLGKDTECVSTLVPLDTYKSAPEYGKDFPWFSPQEIKRSKDPLKFQKDVNKHLSDWKKSALIDEVIMVSDKKGDDGVTDSFISYIAKHTGKSKSDIIKKYDYSHIEIDENGNAKTIPENLVKSVKAKEEKNNKKTTDKAKNDTIAPKTLSGLYTAIKWAEYSKRALSDAISQDKHLKTQLKQDSKDLSKLGSQIKKIESEIKKDASSAKVSSSDLNKAAKEPLEKLKSKKESTTENSLKEAKAAIGKLDSIVDSIGYSGGIDPSESEKILTIPEDMKDLPGLGDSAVELKVLRKSGIYEGDPCSYQTINTYFHWMLSDKKENTPKVPMYIIFEAWKNGKKMDTFMIQNTSDGDFVRVSDDYDPNKTLSKETFDRLVKETKGKVNDSFKVHFTTHSDLSEQIITLKIIRVGPAYSGYVYSGNGDEITVKIPACPKKPATESKQAPENESEPMIMIDSVVDDLVTETVDPFTGLIREKKINIAIQQTSVILHDVLDKVGQAKEKQKETPQKSDTTKKTPVKKTEQKKTEKPSDEIAIIRAYSIATMMTSSAERPTDLDVLKQIKNELTSQEYRILTDYLDSRILEIRNSVTIPLKNTPITNAERSQMLVELSGAANIPPTFNEQKDQKPSNEKNKPDFEILLKPDSMRLPRGGYGEVDVTVKSLNGWNDRVWLKIPIPIGPIRYPTIVPNIVTPTPNADADAAFAVDVSPFSCPGQYRMAVYGMTHDQMPMEISYTYFGLEIIDPGKIFELSTDQKTITIPKGGSKSFSLIVKNIDNTDHAYPIDTNKFRAPAGVTITHQNLIGSTSPDQTNRATVTIKTSDDIQTPLTFTLPLRAQTAINCDPTPTEITSVIVNIVGDAVDSTHDQVLVPGSKYEPETTQPSNTKPTLSLPKQVTQEATGPSGANVAFSTSSQDKEDGSLTPICNPQSGSMFPIGATTVSCTVTDSNNNSISGSFTVTVRDTTPPAFAPFQPTEGVRDDTGVQVFFDVTANDLVDGNVPVSCNYQSGYKFPPGVTELKCSTSDSRGNQSTKTVQITVTVTESGQ